MTAFIPRSLAPFERYPNELAPNRVKLGQLLDHHVALSQRFLGAGGALWITDLWMLGVAQRSFHLVEGFIQAFDAWNVTVAAPIVRMQIDSLVRTVYVAQAPNREEIIAEVMGGTRLGTMKTHDTQQPLTDRALVERAGMIHEWLPPVYERSNEWVHFSDRHIFNAVQSDHSVDREVFGIHGRIPMPIEQIPVSFFAEILGAMREATRTLFGWLELWEEAKKQHGDGTDGDGERNGSRSGA